MVTRVGTIKAQHLNTIIYRTITISIVTEVLGGSVGGFYKRFRRSRRSPFAGFFQISYGSNFGARTAQAKAANRRFDAPCLHTVAFVGATTC
jgi:hypothetical protein